jgi:hypothetical protein
VKPVRVLVVLLAFAACGREGPISSQLVSATPTVDPSPVGTAPATPTPDATQTPGTRPSPTPDATPAPTSAPGDAGIFGSVQAGPTCPVEQENSPCPDRPVTDAEVTATQDGTVAGRTTTDEEGKFRLRLRPGTYDVTASSRSVMACDTQRIVVNERQYTPVRITCDTGIR